MSEEKSGNTDVKPCDGNNKVHDSEKESQNSWQRNKYKRNTFDFKRGRGGSFRGGYRDNNFSKKPYKRKWSNSENGKRKKLEVGNRLKECDVGITEFVGEHGFSGVIKERYTDFHVNEIDLQERVAKLTNQDIPPDVEEVEDLDELKKAVSEEIWNQLQTLKEPGPQTIEIDVTDLDKDQRRAIHAIIKTISNGVSQTIDKNSRKIMLISTNQKQNWRSQNVYKDRRVDWKKRGGDYCHFLLHKVNMDTMDALNQIAMNMRMKSNYFNYAGTKDRRAWTTQWVSLRKVEPSDILKAAKGVRGAYVGNFKFTKEPLKLGMLYGNRFRIALRNVTGTDEQIESAMVSLRDNGFINYYGLQRFGTVAAIPTYDIGKALLQGKWSEAIELILKPREGEQDMDLVEARKIFETTKDAFAAYRKIRRPDKIEATLLKGIQTSGINNPQGALDSIPRNTRLMYIHAYQSYVWNHMVSKRIKEFGRNPIVGDLVYQNSVKETDIDKSESIYDNENESTNKENENDLESNAEADKIKSEPESEIEKTESVSSDIGKTSKESDESEAASIKDVTDATESSLKIDEPEEQKDNGDEKNENEDVYNLPEVKILQEEDLPNYTLADVVMPQVGWKVTYPPYAKPWFDEFLAKDGLTTDLRQKNKKYSLGGAYRKILRIPSDLSWKIMHYKERHSDLIMCDIDEMRKSVPPKDEPEGQYKALILEMSLKSSTYATMALREILKSDTSPQAQAAQSAACNEETKDTDKEITLKDEKNEDVTNMEVDTNDVEEEKDSKMESTESKDDEKEISDSIGDTAMETSDAN